MKRRWAALLVAAIGGAAALAALLRPSPPEEFPMASRVPEDALLYAGFKDYRELERLFPSLVEPHRSRLEEARPHLSGEAAVYLDARSEWVFLARLNRASALLADVEIEDGAAVLASTPGALARHKARTKALADLPAFRALRSRIFVNLGEFRLPYRLRDFSALGLEITEGVPLVLRGRALFRGGLFRTYLEHYVQAPLLGAPEGPAPLRASLTENFTRLWDETLYELSDLDRGKVEHEAAVLSRDFLDGGSVRAFLGRLGPSWGFAVTPTSRALPAFVGWVDLPEPGTGETLARMIHRTAHDLEKAARDRAELPSFELAAEGGVWRVNLSGAKALRWSGAFSPAYAFRDNRLIFSTCADDLDAPAGVSGGRHAAVEVEVAPLLEAARSLAPLLVEPDFWPEAERAAARDFHRMYTPSAMAALRRQIPDAYEREKRLAAQRDRMAVEAMLRLAQTPRYEEALRRKRGEIESWGRPLGGLERAAFQGRFTAEGFEVELQLWTCRIR